MFRSKKYQNKRQAIDTLISNKAKIVGDLHFSGGLHIDGLVQGNVFAEDVSSSMLIIGDKGRVEGNIQVPNMMIAGTVVGDVHTNEQLELGINAVVTGNVFYHLLQMAIGAKVNGNLIYRAKQQQPCLTTPQNKLAHDHELVEVDASESA